MERLFENAVKTALITKLFVWALVTLVGALLLALPGLFSKPQDPGLNNSLTANNNSSEDPYNSPDGNAENIRALRYL